jgi:acetolactate synthase-1/2/3 large subunit
MHEENDSMTVSEYIIDQIAQRGVSHIFGYTGARSVSLVEAIYRRSGIKFVNVYHEQSASYAACAYAQSGGGMGVAVSTSGPGGTNMLTGIANAFCDSIPCLFLTGQAPLGGLRGEATIRNRSVQEVDIVAMASPVSKYAVCIRDKNHVRYETEKALFLATDGRPGPVLLDIPEDIQKQSMDFEKSAGFFPDVILRYEVPKGIRDAIEISRRPIILVGNGAHGFEEKITALAKATKTPVVASMSGIDVCDNSYENYLGVVGNYGLRCANLALANSDLIVSFGCGMTARYTGADVRRFAPEAKVIRVDIDLQELKDRTLKPDELKICRDLKDFFAENGNDLLRLSPSQEWIERIGGYKRRYYYENRTNDFTPYSVLYTMNGLRKAGDTVCADDGQNQIWAIQASSFEKGQRFVSSSGLSAMGYSIPAAVGAHYARPEADILCLCGDGGLQMSIQELQLLKRENLPVTIVVMNNGCLGMIRMLQDTYYGGRHYASVDDYSAPDFVSVANAYGIEAVSVDSLASFRDAFVSRGGRPFLIDVRIDPTFDVRPRITNRRPIEDQFPFLSDAELAENMIVPYEREK